MYSVVYWPSGFKNTHDFRWKKLGVLSPQPVVPKEKEQ